MWGSVGALVPLADLLNHSRAADPVGIELGVGGGAARLRNTAGLRAGAEAHTNYGEGKGNEELLAACVPLRRRRRQPPPRGRCRADMRTAGRYGFALRQNPADGVTLLLRGGSGDELPCRLGRGGDIPLELWRALSGDVRPWLAVEGAGEEMLEQWVTPATIAALREVLLHRALSFKFWGTLLEKAG
jgi:hypothetical protein